MKLMRPGDRSESSKPISRAVQRSLAVCGIGAAVFGLTAGNAFAVTTTVVASFTLNQGDWGGSSGYDNGVVSLVFQSDGNLVLYRDSDNVALWASHTESGDPAVRATDLDWSQSGYIKLKNSAGSVICTVGAGDPAPGGVADIQSDGNFVFYNTSGAATWASNTAGLTQGSRTYCSGGS